ASMNAGGAVGKSNRSMRGKYDSAFGTKIGDAVGLGDAVAVGEAAATLAAGGDPHAPRVSAAMSADARSRVKVACWCAFTM
ncbi:MAG: hypothetical protein QOH08_2212, partial [Chloroflexota bacterium]|nr:hypothetical protein [Chloroflexota bacterium]